MATEPSERFHCGQLYLTNRFCMILECTSCHSVCGVYSEFLDHVFDNHFDDWVIEETSRNEMNEGTTPMDPKKPKTEDELYVIDSTERIHCGDMYLTTNFCMILECNTCDRVSGVYNEFLGHVFEKHGDELNMSENSRRESTKRHATLVTGKLTINDQYETNKNEYITEILQPMGDGTSFEVEDIIEVETQTESTGQVLPTKKVRPVRVKPVKHNSGERKYKCKVCGLAFAEYYNLRGHEMRHSAIKPFTCLQCDKAFYTRTELTTHIRRHTGEKPFVCPYCGRGFVTAGLLTMHERRHTNDRQHQCEQCDKSFFDSSQLKMHQVVHTKERNYKCKVCYTKFTRKVSLQTHMKLHENALRYECIICHKRFNQRPTLLWHIKSKHHVWNTENDDKDASEIVNENDMV